MPSKHKQIQFRSPWLREVQGDRADKIAQALLGHQAIKDAIEQNKCPVCGLSFDDCEYFKRLDDE